MDERYDMVRSVRDGRYVYVRNYMPYRIYGQYIDYMFQTPTTAVWKKLHDEGKLNAAQKAFWNTKPVEELYDLSTDRDEIHNLAASAQHRKTLERMRKAQRDLAVKICDVGFLPEGEIHSRAGTGAPYEMGHDPARYSVTRVMDAADQATRGGLPSLSHADPAVRYWAAQGYLVRREVDGALRAALNDASPYVRAIAAEALGRYGSEQDAQLAVAALMEMADAGKNGVFVSLAALTGLDALDGKAAGVKSAIAKLAQEAEGVDTRYKSYLPRLIEKTLAEL
jgi:uncharacterized sulfatase